MTTQDVTRIKDVFAVFHAATATEAQLFAFAQQDCLTLSQTLQSNLAVAAALLQYVRCRAWALYFQRTGRPALARHERARAAVQTRYFRSL